MSFSLETGKNNKKYSAAGNFGLLPCEVLNIIIKPGKSGVYIINSRVVSSCEPLSVRLLRAPRFVSGKRRMRAFPLDCGEDEQAQTELICGATGIHGGAVMEHSMATKYVPYTPAEHPHCARFLCHDSIYVLQIRNEGSCGTEASVAIVFSEPA